MRPNAKAERNALMVEKFRAGVGMSEIGAEFGISRQAVHQIVHRLIAPGEIGGARLTSARKRAEKAKNIGAKLEAISIAKYGVSHAEWKRLSKDGVIRKFLQHRDNAAGRGIAFELTFLEWHSIWIESGKFSLCGKGKGKYCMSRFNDSGPYAVGNVEIKACVENSREASEKWIGKTKAFRGVFHLYPGNRRPWRATAHGKTIGYFETQELAAKARDSALSQPTQQDA